MSGGLLMMFGAGCALLALHPFTTYPLSLALWAKLRGVKAAAEGAPSREAVAIVVCARNEEASIGATVGRLAEIAAAHDDVSIHVFADGCEDRTASIVRRAAPAARLVESEQRRGKSVGMNTLLDGVDAGIIAFTDANVLLAHDTPAILRARFGAEADLGCLCGHLVYVNAADGATAAAGSIYWRLEERIKRLESDTGAVVGADGSIFAIRRDAWAPVPEDIIDDFYTSMRILAEGWAVRREERLIAQERAATTLKGETRRKVRIACRAFNAHRLLWPKVRRLGAGTLYKVFSHRILRYFSFPLQILSIAAFAGGATLQGWPILAVLAVVFGLVLPFVAAALPLWGLRVLGAFQISLAAASWGVVQSLRGERYMSWARPEG